MIETLLSDKKEIQHLQQSVKSIPVLAKKKEWAEYWTGSHDAPFHIRLIAFAIVEGIFFSASFVQFIGLKRKKEI